MAALCRQCTHIVSDRASRGTIALRVVSDEGLPLVRANERRLQQVLINLITNAVKFTPPGGNARVAIDPAHDGGIVIVAADTGIGISICKSLVEVDRGFQQSRPRHHGTRRSAEIPDRSTRGQA